MAFLATVALYLARGGGGDWVGVANPASFFRGELGEQPLCLGYSSRCGLVSIQFRQISSYKLNKCKYM